MEVLNSRPNTLCQHFLLKSAHLTYRLIGRVAYQRRNIHASYLAMPGLNLTAGKKVQPPKVFLSEPGIPSLLHVSRAFLLLLKKC